MSADDGGRRRLGAAGEELAGRWLEERGWAVLDRNWRCRYGELDLVATDPDGALVFVEVKTRRSVRCGTPVEAVGVAKARRLRVLAWAWLAEHDEHARAGRRDGFRIDLVGVLAGADGLADVEHLTAVA